MLLLKAVGVQSEARLPFAGLHQLLQAILYRADELPERQRRALLTGLGLIDGEVPDVFLIGLATLDLLSDSAVRAPILVVAEDVQWVDGPTREVLAFVARRLDAERIVLLAGSRNGPPGPLGDGGLDELELGALDDGAAARLLDAVGPGLAPALRERLLVLAEGNPLALVELPVAWSGMRDGTLLPAFVPLTSRLEHAFAARVRELPSHTQTVLRVAALNDGDSIAEAIEAASVLAGERLAVDDFTPAVSAQLVNVDELGVRFRHPLVRSAIHQGATLPERLATHAVLADVAAAERDRSVWHLAASIIEPDEAVARQLDETAGRVVRRHGAATAVSALERAAQLSVDSARKGERLLRAAELAFELGRRDVVVRLLEEAQPLDLSDLERGRLLWLRDVFDEPMPLGTARVGASIALAEQMNASGDTDRALDSLFSAALRCWWFNADQEALDLVVDAACGLGAPAADPKLLCILAMIAPQQYGPQLREHFSRRIPQAGEDPEALRNLGVAATQLGAFDHATRFLTASIDGFRAQGRLGLLARALASQALTSSYVGNWNLAMSCAEEAGALMRETAQARWGATMELVMATVLGIRGDYVAAEALIAGAEQVLLPTRANPMLAMVQLARGATAIAAGRHQEAFEQLRRVLDPTDIAHHEMLGAWGLIDFIEAATHVDRSSEARAVLSKMERLGAATQSPLLLVGIGCSRPLLAADDEAEALFGAGLAMDLSRWPFHRARLLLAHGVWLRRQRRPADSRAPLRAAREAFDALGTAPWGERARQELRASGETSRHHSPALTDRLSPQELQIAQLAASGLSNRDIGQALYLSHRTIGSHLYRIFPKLGVVSRSELRDALAES
jgi:DNA-binding CsgD family transcriptional regulator